MHLCKDFCVSRPAMTLNVDEHLYPNLLEIIKLAYLLQNCFWSVSERNQNANKTQPKRKTKLASYPDCRVTVSCFNISLDDCVLAMNPERNTKTQPKCETVCRFAPKRNSKRKTKHAKSFFVRGLPNLNRKLVSVRGCRKK